MFLNKQWISPCKVLEPLIETYRACFDRRRITLESSLAAAETVHIQGDPDRLAQVFINILENATSMWARPERCAFRERPTINS